MASISHDVDLTQRNLLVEKVCCRAWSIVNSARGPSRIACNIRSVEGKLERTPTASTSVSGVSSRERRCAIRPPHLVHRPGRKNNERALAGASIVNRRFHLFPGEHPAHISPGGVRRRPVDSTEPRVSLTAVPSLSPAASLKEALVRTGAQLLRWAEYRIVQESTTR